MHIDVWADFACPWSYLGIHHLRDALTRFEHRDQVEVRFHAYLLDPEQSSVLEMSQAEFLVHTHPGMSLDEADEARERMVFPWTLNPWFLLRPPSPIRLWLQLEKWMNALESRRVQQPINLPTPRPCSARALKLV